MLLEVVDLCHLIAEVACVLSHLFAADLEQGSHLGIALSISLARIEGDDVAGLGIVEQLLLLLVLDIERHQDGAVYRHAALLGVAVLVELAQVALDGVVALEVVGIDIATHLRGKHLHLTVDECVVHGDVVVVYLVAGAELTGKLGSHGNVELESEGAVLLQILCLVLL